MPPNAPRSRAEVSSTLAAMLEELHGTFMGANALGLVLDPDWRPPADPKVIPVRLLRKLHANLNDFIVEAKAAENAWLLREASR